jgi:hypothetical protein
MNKKFPTGPACACELLFTIGPVCSQAASPSGAYQSTGADRATYRFEFINDFFFGTDQEISGFWSLQNHTAVAGSWDKLKTVLDVVKRFGAAIPTLTADGRV